MCRKLGLEALEHHQYVREQLVRSKLSDYITARSLEEEDF